MQRSSLDHLARSIGTSTSRRGVLAALLASLAGMTASRRSTAAACHETGRRCGNRGQPKCATCCSGCTERRGNQRICVCCAVDASCTRNGDCCSGRCQGRRCQPPAAFAICEKGEASVSFTKGPENPPVGSGSARFTVGSTGLDDEGYLRSDRFAGTRLADLRTLEYATYVQTEAHCGPSGQAPFLVLRVAKTGATEPDDVLIFEPVYMDDGPGILCGQWQRWNALDATARWWSVTDPNVFFPFATYIAANPGATIQNVVSDPDCPDALGGLRIEAGEGVPWSDFVGNVDFLTLKVAGQPARTFDF